MVPPRLGRRGRLGGRPAWTAPPADPLPRTAQTNHTGAPTALLAALATAADALARLDAQAALLAPALQDGLRTRLAYAEPARAGLRTLAALRGAAEAAMPLAASETRRSRLLAALELLLQTPAVTAASLARALAITPRQPCACSNASAAPVSRRWWCE
jgi:hypothetical protein